jgi:hypothetical protein
MSRERFFLRLPMLSLTLFCGCVPELCSSPGRQGRTQYAYAGPDCLLGCPARAPLLVGIREPVSVSTDLAAPTTTRSASPGVLSVEPGEVRQRCCTTGDGGTRCLTLSESAAQCTARGGVVRTQEIVTVVANAAGSADLETRDPTGALVDSFGMTVAAAASLRVEVSAAGRRREVPPGEAVTLSGDTSGLVLTLLTGDGRALHAPRALSVTSSDPRVVQTDVAEGAVAGMVSSGAIVGLRPVGSGRATLRVVNGGLVREVEVIAP